MKSDNLMGIITDQHSRQAPENAERQSPEPLSCIAPIERHPWEPFIPDGAKVLMLGSFPPKENRWSMDFFYPNFINDMRRIISTVFFGDKDHFILKQEKRFDKTRIMEFCEKHGLALYDTAYEVRRMKDNASDKFLEIVSPVDIESLLMAMPECRAVITTGEKASETVAARFGCQVPKTGKHTEITLPAASGKAEKRKIGFYRLPSSSRAYPMSLENKAAAYSVLRELLSQDGPTGRH